MGLLLAHPAFCFVGHNCEKSGLMVVVVVAGVADAHDLLDHRLYLGGEEGELCTDNLPDIYHAVHLGWAALLCDLDGMGLLGVESQVSELAHGEDMDAELALDLSV